MFDTRIEIVAKSAVRDEYNELNDELAPIALCYAQKTENGGRKMVDAGAIVYADDTEYTIRWRQEVKVGQFVIDNEQKYEIVAAREIGRRRLLKLTCKLHNNAETESTRL